MNQETTQFILREHEALRKEIDNNIKFFEGWTALQWLGLGGFLLGPITFVTSPTAVTLIAWAQYRKLQLAEKNDTIGRYIARLEQRICDNGAGWETHLQGGK